MPERKLVFVDDETHIRSLLEQSLEVLEDDYDVELLGAADGEEGLELIRREKPQLVLLDVMMPKMNGYEVCQTVTSEMPETKVVLLTAKGQQADKEQGLEAGALEYLTKPFDPDEMVERAKTLLGLED